VTAEPRAVDAIIDRCARLPLALVVAAALAAIRPTLPLAALADELDQASGGLDALHGGDAATDVRAVFSCSYRTLSPAGARLFRLLGLHPGADIGIAAAASLAGLPVGPTRSLLTELTRANLLTEHSLGRFACHDLLRSYAAEQARRHETAAQRREATERVLDHYVHTAHAAVLRLDPARDPLPLEPPGPGVVCDPPEDPMDWFASEHRVLVTAVQHAGDRRAWQLAQALTTFFDFRGLWHDLIATQQAALAVLQRLGDVPGQANAHRDIGRTEAQLGNYDVARTHLDQALVLFERSDDAFGQGRTHHNIGWMLQAQERYAEAVGHAERALALFRSAGKPLWQARVLNAAGWLHAQLGDYRQTLANAEQALPLLQELGDRHGAAGTWDSLGYAYHHLGDHPSSVSCYRRAAEMFRELGDRATEAVVLDHLGDAYHEAGEHRSAARVWQEALALLEGLDHPEADQIRAKVPTRR
jgi:tetratricopeptide (TPR) repeat protein